MTFETPCILIARPPARIQKKEDSNTPLSVSSNKAPENSIRPTILLVNTKVITTARQVLLDTMMLKISCDSALENNCDKTDKLILLSFC